MPVTPELLVEVVVVVAAPFMVILQATLHLV
jgi:hypothetical protein